MLTSKFLNPADAITMDAMLTTRRSKLFARRAAVRYHEAVPAQPPSDLPDQTVAPEKAMALAVVDETAPTCMQPSVNDLVIAAVEPTPETAASLPPSKVKKPARKRKNEVLGVVRPKPSRRKTRRVNEGVARATAVGEEVENSG